LDLLTGIYALFIYRKQTKSHGFTYVEGPDKKTDGTIGFVGFFRATFM
jgi:hypothetical protein